MRNVMKNLKSCEEYVIAELQDKINENNAL